MHTTFRISPAWRTFLALTLLALTAAPALAEVIVTTKTEHYPVNGLTHKEIAENIKRQSPIVQDGRTFQAHTQSNIRYEFSWTRRNGRCAMKQATVFINITYKYPRLADTPNAQTLRWWQAHLDKLAEHELVHGQYALEAAHELDQALNSLSDLDCATVKDVVKALGDATLETLQERQRTYDALTDHGLQQHEHTGQ
jgi:predicted secreted Zn-dependent protease